MLCVHYLLSMAPHNRLITHVPKKEHNSKIIYNKATTGCRGGCIEHQRVISEAVSYSVTITNIVIFLAVKQCKCY